MEYTTSTIRRDYLIADGSANRFRSMDSWKDWYEDDMSKLILFLINNNQLDAYRNNYELGFVQGDCICDINEGDLVFSADMKYHTLQKRNMRKKVYKFGDIILDPAVCWFVAYRQLSSQIVKRFNYERVSPSIDNVLRDNVDCPCCLEKLEGMLFKCENEHQVCLTCFEGLCDSGRTKKCPVCRSMYKDTEIARYETVKGNKNYVSQEIHFTGNGVERECKLVGLIHAVKTDSSYSPTMTLLITGLYYYVMLDHKPLLENKTNYSFLTLEMLDNESWNDFFNFVKTDYFKDIIYSFKKLDPPYDYGESMFLTDTGSKYGTDALNILTEQCGTYWGKRTLMFKMFYEFRFITMSNHQLKEILKNIINKAFRGKFYKKIVHITEIEIK